MKTLKELLAPWIQINEDGVVITGLYNDSREVQAGGVFFAYPGASTDGRRYLNQAVRAGAIALVYEPHNWPTDVSLPETCFSIPFPDVAQHLAALASRFYEEPTKKLSLTGITGTNGKTTIAYQLAQAHELLSVHAAYIGTLGFGPIAQLHSTVNTTPDGLHLQSLCHDYLRQGIKQVCMEVSSHALAQGRVDHMFFRQAIFTNLTLDHLDYHHTMDAYAAAKASLFARPSLEWSILNHDDEYFEFMKAALAPSCRLITYGIKEGSDVRARHWEVTMTGTLIWVESPWGQHQIRISALGYFNIYNALAVFTSLMVSGYDLDKVIEVMAKLKPAPGRMDVVAQDPCILVDYAHTPDALENVILTLNKVKTGRLFVVFGCGGDRDKSKRPIMGDIVARHADVAIITSDNPRSEDPEQIMRDIEQGMTQRRQDVYHVIDREQAIAKAISLAEKDDIILVAGKGHEDYQQIGQVKYPFSDRDVIAKLLETIT